MQAGWNKTLIMSIIVIINKILHHWHVTIRPPQRYEDGLGYLVHHLMYAFRQRFRQQFAATGCKLTPEGFAVMNILRLSGPKTHAQLAVEMAKDRAAVTRLLHGLEQQQLIQRRTDHLDRRKVWAHLTDKGRHMHDQWMPLLHELLYEALQGISGEEFEVTRRVLRKIIRNLGESPGKTPAV